jgi:hypothetical protein
VGDGANLTLTSDMVFVFSLFKMNLIESTGSV